MTRAHKLRALSEAIMQEFTSFEENKIGWFLHAFWTDSALVDPFRSCIAFDLSFSPTARLSVPAFGNSKELALDISCVPPCIRLLEVEASLSPAGPAAKIQITVIKVRCYLLQETINSEYFLCRREKNKNQAHDVPLILWDWFVCGASSSSEKNVLRSRFPSICASKLKLSLLASVTNSITLTIQLTYSLLEKKQRLYV